MRLDALVNWKQSLLTLKVPEKLQLYGLYVYCVVHICDFGMLRVNELSTLVGLNCSKDKLVHLICTDPLKPVHHIMYIVFARNTRVISLCSFRWMS